MRYWEPYIPNRYVVILEASCCEQFVLCTWGNSEYFVKHRTSNGRELITARGPYGPAARTWQRLSASHNHRKRATS